MVKSVLFDMDGVLINSVDLGLQTRKDVLSIYNIDLNEVPDPQGEAHRAASTKTLLKNVKDYCGIHINHDEFAKIVRENMQRKFQEHGLSVDQGLVVFLKDLKNHDIVCAIVSSGLKEGVDIKLNALGIKKYFSAIVTGSDVNEHKPHPESYIHAMKQLKLAPKDCIVIEDSLTGIQAGQAAGCKVIEFTQYNQSKEPAPGTIATIKNWDEINFSILNTLLND